MRGRRKIVVAQALQHVSYVQHASPLDGRCGHKRARFGSRLKFQTAGGVLEEEREGRPIRVGGHAGYQFGLEIRRHGLRVVQEAELVVVA